MRGVRLMLTGGNRGADWLFHNKPPGWRSRRSHFQLTKARTRREVGCREESSDGEGESERRVNEGVDAASTKYAEEFERSRLLQKLPLLPSRVGAPPRYQLVQLQTALKQTDVIQNVKKVQEERSSEAPSDGIFQRTQRCRLWRR